MERVAFLIESTGERLGCLLNPESLVMRRWAGIRARSSIGGPVRGTALADDPLLYTGGGTTELLLDLLFDVSLAGSTIQTSDVRELTRPLWRLAENAEVVNGYGRPPLVRFVWGKAWNVPAVVAAVAERLEQFDAGGAPRRSWLRMRLLRVGEAAAAEPTSTPMAVAEGALTPSEAEADLLEIHEVVGGGPLADEETENPAGQRLDELAERYYGDASLWRLIAEANGIDDPQRVPAGVLLRIPRKK